MTNRLLNGSRVFSSSTFKYALFVYDVCLGVFGCPRGNISQTEMTFPLTTMSRSMNKFLGDNSLRERDSWRVIFSLRISRENE